MGAEQSSKSSSRSADPAAGVGATGAPGFFERQAAVLASARATLGVTLAVTRLSVHDNVKLPAGEDLDEWLAVNMVQFVNQASVLFDALKEEQVCTTETCPTMTAGSRYSYAWLAPGSKKPQALPAPEYVAAVVEWAHSLMGDESVFPTEEGVPFPADFKKKTVATILKRIFRIYAHVYHHHFGQVRDLGHEAHLNTQFRVFLAFVVEFDLISAQQLSPLKPLIERLVEAETFQRLFPANESSGAPSASSGVATTTATDTTSDSSHSGKVPSIAEESAGARAASTAASAAAAGDDVVRRARSLDKHWLTQSPAFQGLQESLVELVTVYHLFHPESGQIAGTNGVLRWKHAAAGAGAAGTLQALSDTRKLHVLVSMAFVDVNALLEAFVSEFLRELFDKWRRGQQQQQPTGGAADAAAASKARLLSMRDEDAKFAATAAELLSVLNARSLQTEGVPERDVEQPPRSPQIRDRVIDKEQSRVERRARETGGIDDDDAAPLTADELLDLHCDRVASDGFRPTLTEFTRRFDEIFGLGEPKRKGKGKRRGAAQTPAAAPTRSPLHDELCRVIGNPLLRSVAHAALRARSAPNSTDAAGAGPGTDPDAGTASERVLVPSYEGFDTLTRLYYGIRCALAHGSSASTCARALVGVTVEDVLPLPDDAAEPDVLARAAGGERLRVLLERCHLGKVELKAEISYFDLTAYCRTAVAFAESITIASSRLVALWSPGEFASSDSQAK